MQRSVLLLLTGLLLVATGCATTGTRRKAKTDLERVLDQALLLMGESKVRVGQRPFRSDCSGFVTACYSTVDLELIDPEIPGDSGTQLIYRSLKKRGRIVARSGRPGDLAFFHNTWDRNGNSLRDDRFTHIALVEAVDPDGTVHLVHYASGEVKRAVLNLRHRGTARDPSSGRIWNSYLRRGGGRVLSGQLFFRFGRPLRRPY